MEAPTRRTLLHATAALATLSATRTRAETTNLALNGAPSNRDLTTAFPQKGAMVLQRTRPPLLETPFEVFDQGVFTPNDRFFVRWHWSNIPDTIDLATFRLAIRGHVTQPQSLSMTDILALPRYEIAAVNQCSGNSRGLFQPRIAGGQWQNGAMGNAKWTGVRLRDVLDRAGVKPGATTVRFNGLDDPVVPEAPDFLKSLSLDHARDGEVMLAYQMNGEQLPLLNGFPLRLVVPGWFSTYWVKMLADIEILDKPDDNFWMKSAYLIPATPHAAVQPGQTGFPTEPISRMIPRSFFTNVTSATTIKPGAPIPLRGIAFGGDCAVTTVETSVDAGKTWRAATLGRDEGPYSFRQWTAEVTAPENTPENTSANASANASLTAMVRCTNTKKEVQQPDPIWNPGGFMRNNIESVTLKIA